MGDYRNLVETFWQAFDRFDFAAAGELLHDDFVFELPQSKERVRGRANFVAFNTYYPGQWRIAIQHLAVCDDEAITEITASSDGQVNTAISFFRFKDGKISHIREFWPEPFSAQAWRAQWVEMMD
ncbi:MAG: nuclear transport factor 2 family protein [Chloroflexi bacterium]|nr:nuclear transport factor 2 family protein [Chloroflexota bacterium]